MKKGQKFPERAKEKIRRKLLGRHSSIRTEFKKGQIPWNKGFKRRGLQYAYHSNSSTKFKPGHRPWNWKPVGTVVMRADNRKKRVRLIKIAEPNKWEYHSRYIWEATRGRKISKGFIVYHLDGDSLNDSPENLSCVPRSVHIKWQRLDIENFEPKRLERSIKAQKARWQEYRMRLVQEASQ